MTPAPAYVEIPAQAPAPHQAPAPTPGDPTERAEDVRARMDALLERLQRGPAPRSVS